MNPKAYSSEELARKTQFQLKSRRDSFPNVEIRSQVRRRSCRDLAYSLSSFDLLPPFSILSRLFPPSPSMCVSIVKKTSVCACRKMEKKENQEKALFYSLSIFQKSEMPKNGVYLWISCDIRVYEYMESASGVDKPKKTSPLSKLCLLLSIVIV